MSSQFLTALLMALPLTGRRVTVQVIGELISKPYIDITLNLMARFGVTVERDGWAAFTVDGSQRYHSPGVIHVGRRRSSASYFLAAGALGRGPVRVEGVGSGSIQGDVRFADALAAIGADIRWGDNWIEARGTGRVKAFDADFNHIPDAAMTLAVAALAADGRSVLRNIGSWRVKKPTASPPWLPSCAKSAPWWKKANWLAITPPAQLTPNAAIDTYDDHRMAMCFLAGGAAGAPVRINDPKCVGKTFPVISRLSPAFVSRPECRASHPPAWLPGGLGRPAARSAAARHAWPGLFGVLMAV